MEVQAVVPSHESLRCRVAASDGPAPRTVEVRIRKEELARLPRPASVRLTVTKPTSEVGMYPHRSVTVLTGLAVLASGAGGG